jgi:Cu(I)/Ag(I) efflux system membrane fusion protein
MKISRLIAIAVSLCLALAGLIYIGDSDSPTDGLTPIAAASPGDSTWVCPMHPEIVQDHPGSCPICGMHLVEAADPPVPSAETAPADGVWVCPMHAHIVQDHPGNCPVCGMDLVSAPGARQHAEPGVTVDPATIQRLGVRLAEARQQPLSREIHTYGEVVIDQSTLVNISPKTDGWIRSISVHAAGDPVRAGEPLYAIYSPELIQRQREYIDVLRRRDKLLSSFTTITGQNAQALASLARQRRRLRDKFLYTDLTRQQLEDLEAFRRPQDVVTIQSPVSGFASQVNARAGDYVSPLTTLLSVATTASVWVNIEIYPDQSAWVAEGDTVLVRIATPRLRSVRGTLRFASPVATGAARTRTARLTLDNTELGLTPGTLVEAVIVSAPRSALVVPRSAILHSGRGDTVMLSRGDGHFTPTSVETGLETGELVEITRGLQAGDQVAVNGQFLLDAAASMNATRRRLQGGAGE